MRLRRLHRWTVTPREAAAIQRRLAARVVLAAPPRRRVRLVAGLDCAYTGGRVLAAAVVLRIPPGGPSRSSGGLSPQGTVPDSRVVTGSRRPVDVVESVVVSMKIPFPYVPGLLSFREAPAMARALRRLRTVPDVLLVDGQGLAHPRRMGLACHVGLLAGIPTVGVAKSLLVGAFRAPARPAGSSSPLLHRGAVVGAALRLREGGNPVFVSPGHLCDLRAAVRWTLRCAAGHRLPEPVFQADRAVGEAAAALRAPG